MNIVSIALSGMRASEQRVERAAETSELPDRMMSLLAAETEYATNVRVARAGQAMERRALDVMA